MSVSLNAVNFEMKPQAVLLLHDEKQKSEIASLIIHVTGT
jgi:hypothetical protein